MNEDLEHPKEADSGDDQKRKFKYYKLPQQLVHMLEQDDKRLMQNPGDLLLLENQVQMRKERLSQKEINELMDCKVPTITDNSTKSLFDYMVSMIPTGSPEGRTYENMVLTPEMLQKLKLLDSKMGNDHQPKQANEVISTIAEGPMRKILETKQKFDRLKERPGEGGLDEEEDEVVEELRELDHLKHNIEQHIERVAQN